MALKDKQLRFIDEYLIDLNATQAAIRAGYSPKTATPMASRLLTNVNVQDALVIAQKKLADSTEITPVTVMRDIQLIKDDAMQIRANETGEESMLDRAGALKACELQGRRLGMWQDKVQHSGDSNAPVQVFTQINYTVVNNV